MVIHMSEGNKFMTEKESNDKLTLVMAEGTAEGIILAFRLFTQQNKFDLEPTDMCKRPMHEAMDVITSDFQKERNSMYPYKESIKEAIGAVVFEYRDYLKLLQLGEDWDHAKQLMVWITAGTSIEFFHNRSKETADLIKAIKQLPSGGPNA